MFRRAFLFLAGSLAVAGCSQATAFISGYVPPANLNPQGSGIASSLRTGATVALLAPLTGPNAERGQALVQAAQLALSEPGSPPLNVHDTGGTPEGAARAAQAALAAGAGLIIGPLTSAETAAVAAPARNAHVPVLAFTNAPSQAQPGVWPMGITPSQQVRRMVGSLAAQGKTRFAAVLPPSDFGAAMGTALSQATSAAGVPPPDIHVHDGSNTGIASAMRDVSGYANRRGPLDAQIKAARAKHTAEGRREAADLSRQDIAPAPFDALLLADTGEKLAWLATFLEYYDIEPPSARVLGPALWASASGRGGAGLGGAWYAAPDPAARATFSEQFQGKFGVAAPGIADFAYDAASIARVIALGGGGYTIAALCRPEGFAGVDGLLVLQSDGTIRRGLAVFGIERGGITIVDPAPTSAAAPGI